MRVLAPRRLSLLALCLGATAAGAASSHGGADPGVIGRLVVGGGALLVVLATLYYCVRCLRWPGEKDAAHIKRRILYDDW